MQTKGVYRWISKTSIPSTWKFVDLVILPIPIHDIGPREAPFTHLRKKAKTVVRSNEKTDIPFKRVDDRHSTSSFITTSERVWFFLPIRSGKSFKFHISWTLLFSKSRWPKKYGRRSNERWLTIDHFCQLELNC
jgi:hypothetical protein